MRNLRYTTVMVLILLAIVAAACSPSGASNNNQAPTTAPSGATGSQTSGNAATTPGAASGAATASSGAATTPAAMATGSAPQAGNAVTATTTVSGTGATSSGGQAGGNTYGNMKVIQVEPNAHITFSGWGDPTEQQIYRDSITRFNQFYPGVKVDYQPIPSNFQAKLKAQMAGGTAPDVFYVDNQLMSAFGPSGQLLALDDYMAQAGESRNDFIPRLLTIFTQDNKTYGLPKDWGTLGLVYLPEAFKAAGIAEPTANWTWTDLQKAADAIAKNGKYKGYCMAPDAARFIAFVLQNGGNFTTSDFKTATLDKPEVQQAADFIANMKKSGSLVQPSDVGASWCGEAIGKQLVGMAYEGGWMVNFMKQTYPNVQWATQVLPAGPKGQADVIFTNAIGVNAASKFPKAAAAFALFVTSPYNQALIAKTGFAYSTHPDQANLITNPQDKNIMQGGLWKTSVPEYWGPNTGSLESAVSKGLERIFLGAQSAQQSLQQTQQDAQSALGQ
jgi:multiple sugar transport system substrate-binding protein